jgi:hypothetical protein
MTHRAQGSGAQLAQPAIEDCLKNCADCHRICVETINHCLQAGGAHAAADHVGLLNDCAQICQTAQDFLIRRSELHPGVCGACAQACNACADSCDQLGADPQTKACAAMCRACAASCQALAGRP